MSVGLVDLIVLRFTQGGFSAESPSRIRELIIIFLRHTMSDSELTTAKYFQQIEAARSTATAEQIDLPQQERRTTTDAWAKASSWISLIGGGAIAVVLLVFAVGYLVGDGSKKKTYPIDWFLRLGGAKSDQTFEKFVRNTATTNKLDWDEQFRKSPMYQFENSQTPLIDPQKLGWHGGSSSR